MLSIELYVQSFRTHKEAETREDCQDAYSIQSRRGRYAIADGATQSFYPAQWAKLLVEHFCEDTDFLNRNILTQHEWSKWVEPIQQRWYEEIQQEVKKHQEHFIRNRFSMKESAVSTFVGIEFEDDLSEKKRLAWKVMIVGDSCLFQISENTFHSYLMKRSSDFSNQPEYFASFAKDNKYKPEFLHGNAKKGDVFLLATDALAKWILKAKERGQEYWQKFWNTLSLIHTQADFERFIENIRQDPQIPLENDDTTLIIISVGDKNIKSINGSQDNFLAILPNTTKGIKERSEVANSSDMSATGFSFDKWMPKPAVQPGSKVPQEPKIRGDEKKPPTPTSPIITVGQQPFKESQTHGFDEKLKTLTEEKNRSEAQVRILQEQFEGIRRKKAQYQKALFALSCLFILSVGLNVFLFTRKLSTTPNDQNTPLPIPTVTQTPLPRVTPTPAPALTPTVTSIPTASPEVTESPATTSTVLPQNENSGQPIVVPTETPIYLRNSEGEWNDGVELKKKQNLP